MNVTFISVSPTQSMNKRSETRFAYRSDERLNRASRDVTLRVDDLKSMKQFYRNIVGCQLFGEFPSAALLQLCDALGAQIQMLGLLQRLDRVALEHGPLKHLTLLITTRDLKLEKKRLEGLGVGVVSLNHEKNGNPSLTFRDPEGNEVELRCCHPAIDS
jgi:catechol-2,3-dioxygenase